MARGLRELLYKPKIINLTNMLDRNAAPKHQAREQCT